MTNEELEKRREKRTMIQQIHRCVGCGAECNGSYMTVITHDESGQPYSNADICKECWNLFWREETEKNNEDN